MHTDPTTVPSDMSWTHFSPVVTSVPFMVAMQGSSSVGGLLPLPDGSLVGLPGP